LLFIQLIQDKGGVDADAVGGGEPVALPSAKYRGAYLTSVGSVIWRETRTPGEMVLLEESVRLSVGGETLVALCFELPLDVVVDACFC
jgi:hypothetical protein